MPAATHGWLTAGTESLLNYRGCSAATAAADTNLRLWPGLQLCNRHKRRGAYQSINHSFTTSAATRLSLPNKMISGPAWCCLRSQSVYSWLWVRDLFFSQGVYVGEHMSLLQLCSLLFFSRSSSCLSKTWNLCRTFSAARWISHQMLTSGQESGGTQRTRKSPVGWAALRHRNRDRTGKNHGSEVYRSLFWCLF